ncbi:MAG: sodium:calcium antiporter, partial [Terriglobales bacterium]
MLQSIVLLLLALILIVLSAELFTNGIEWLGQRFGLGEGVVGSIFAAVGTAMPETLIPFVAILFFGGTHGPEVGIGAIAGAPFMLSTLTLAVCGGSILIFARSGRRAPELNLNNQLISRDLHYFMIAYSIAICSTFATEWPTVRYVLAGLILSIYPYYVYRTFQKEQVVGT